MRKAKISHCPDTRHSFLEFFAKSGQTYFFRAHRTNDLTKKIEKVGPFECDELEKYCRVRAECYPTTKVPAPYTMAKEKFNSLFLVLLLVSRQTKSQLYHDKGYFICSAR